MPMSRIASALLGAALLTAVAAAAMAAAAPAAAERPAALAAAVRAPAVRALEAAATPKPTSKPSPTPSASPTPPPKPAPPPIPVPTPVMPNPTQNCAPGTSAVARVPQTPWAQRALDFSAVWPLTRGKGVTVAVVDSGVDSSPQLKGRETALDPTGTGLGDCVGHGTAVAAIIAASDMQHQGVAFEGVAPAAQILSVKVVSQDAVGGSSVILAKGIREAVYWGAQVMNISICTGNSPVLRSAVQYALNRNVVIVASAGNVGDGTCIGPGPFYPASYPGVLSVGAVGEDGALATFSDRLSHVGVTAPGEDITSAWPGPGYQTGLEGTSFAAPFVSGVAALVRSRFPRLSAREVVARIEATADGGTGPGTGNGLVNPFQAVTAILGGRSAPSPARSAAAPVPVSRALPPDQTARPALEVAGGSLGAAALVALGAVVFREGRRRRWHAARARLPADGGSAGRPRR
jgi:membrane-anchored mycosin MYCP